MTISKECQLLLRLPPCIRQQLLRRQPWTSHPPNHTQSRLFQSSTRLLARSKPSPPKPKPIQKTNTPSPSPVRKPAPLSTPKLHYGPIDTIETHCEKVLLYLAPKHGTFYASAYFFGITLLIGSFTYATFLKDKEGNPRIPWFTKVLGGIVCFALAVGGTAILLSPQNLIKSIAIVPSPAAIAQAERRILRLEIRRPYPFGKPKVIQTQPSNLALDKDVPVATADVALYDVPKSQAQAFTQKYFSSSSKSERSGILASLSNFNKSLLNAWPVITRETRRMCLNDQIAHLRVKDSVDGTVGNFKLDLQECSLLDGGRPLAKLVTWDPDARFSVARWLKETFGR